MKKKNKNRYQIRRKKTHAERKANMNQKTNPCNNSNPKTDTNYKMVDGSPFYQFLENADCILENWEKGIYPLDDVYPTDPRSNAFLFPLVIQKAQKDQKETHLMTIGCSKMGPSPLQWMFKFFKCQKWMNATSLEVERLLVERLAFHPTNGTLVSKHIWDKDAYTYLLCENWDIISEIKAMPNAKTDTCMVDCSRNYLSFEEQKKLLNTVGNELVKKGIDIIHFLGISKELQECFYDNPAFDENGQVRNVIFDTRISLKTKGLEFGITGLSQKKMEEMQIFIKKCAKETEGTVGVVGENPFFESPFLTKVFSPKE